MANDTRGDYCGLTEPLIMRGTQRVLIPCTHTTKGNNTAETTARLANTVPPVNLHSTMRGRGW